MDVIQSVSDILNKSDLFLLGVFCAYQSSTRFNLPGVLVDHANLYDFSREKIMPSLLLHDNRSQKIDKFQILGNLGRIGNPRIVWMCGHGFLSSDRHNVFLLDAFMAPSLMDNGSDLVDVSEWRTEALLFDTEFHQAVLQDMTTPIVFFVFDFCHSATMLGLKYYYEDGFFFEKIHSAEPTLFDDDENLIRICIAGASDFKTTQEDTREGGELTNFILNLVKKHAKLTLNLISHNRPSNFIISTNTKIDPNFAFFSFDDFLKKF
jgi:hypothetical protein